jgi:hypothetical protein
VSPSAWTTAAELLCSGSCTVNVAAPSQSIRFFRYHWLDSSDNILRTSAAIPTLIP